MANYVSTLTGAQVEAVLGYANNGSSKVYLTYNHQTPAVNKSYNITSITDNATGEFTPNFTNVFTDAFWSTSGTSDEPNNNTAIVSLGIDAVTKVTGSGKIRTNNSQAAATDSLSAEASIVGDLA